MTRCTVHRSLAQLCADFGGTIKGESEIVVTGLATPEQAGPEDLAPLLHHRFLVASTTSRAAAFLIDERLAARVTDRPLWVHPRPRLALARILEELHPEPHVLPGIDPTARVSAMSDVDPSCRIEAMAVIEDGAVVAARTVVGARALVGIGARIGQDCRLGPGCMVLGGCVLGDRVRIGPGAVVGSDGFGFVPTDQGPCRVQQTGHVVLEDDVEIGALAAVDRGAIGETVIRRGAKLDNMVHVGHNAEVGQHAMLAAQCGLAGSSRVGAGALLGGQVGVGDHLHVGPGARIAAKSGVAGDVPAGATYAGYPAVPRSKWLRAWATLLRSLDARRGR
jgi:UDP-3-O-[3-hydroxymyristoyl] glucosamine N-acyltransferase